MRAEEHAQRVAGLRCKLLGFEKGACKGHLAEVDDLF